jgi:hypothetical protein
MELRNVNFGDFIYKIASGIADAQRKLDLNSAELVKMLAEMRVDVPKVTKIIEKDGKISEETTIQNRSLLDLGFTPNCYQFSETTIEVVTDFKIEENSKGKMELKTNVADIRMERRFKRNIDAYSKIKTTLVPVPIPVCLDDNIEIIDKTGE